MSHRRRLPALIGAAALAYLATASVAVAAPAIPTDGAKAAPAPVAPSGPTDPCTSLLALVNRPAVTSTPCSVKRGDLLVETGYTNTTSSGAATGNLAVYPQGYIRVGALRNLELDIAPTSIARISGTTAQLTDSQIGAHYELGYSPKFITGVNFLATIPSGYPAVSGQGTGYTFNLESTYAITSVLGLAAQVGYNNLSAGSPDGVGTVRVQSFNPSLALVLGLPQSFQLFVEGFGASSGGPGQSGRFGLDGGLQKTIGSRLQLDVNASQSLGAFGGVRTHSLGFGAAYLLGS